MKFDKANLGLVGQAVTFEANSEDSCKKQNAAKRSWPFVNSQNGVEQLADTNGLCKRARETHNGIGWLNAEGEAETRSTKELIGAALRKQLSKAARGGQAGVSHSQTEFDRLLASGVSRLATYQVTLVRSSKGDGAAALDQLRARYRNLAAYGVTDTGKVRDVERAAVAKESPIAVDRSRAEEPGSGLTFVVEPRWRQPVRVGCGLNNLVNTCYLNSVLQVLTYTPPLVNYMHTYHAPSACRAQSSRVCMLCVLRQHVSTVHNGARGSISPKQFIVNLKAVARHFRPNSQEDAHEYLRLLLDRLQQDCSQGGGKAGFTKGSREGRNAVAAIYGGTLRSQVACKSCSYVSTVLDPFLDLSLEIRSAARLEDALKRFFAPEMLSGANAYRCDSCKKKVDATKCFKLHALPVVLTVHLKRFSAFGFSKVNKPVAYPETLCLADYRDSDHQRSGYDYKLFAVIAHLGSTPQSGHYVAYARTAIDSAQWYLFDDSRVTAVPRHSAVNNPNAYVLFYSKLYSSSTANPAEHQQRASSSVDLKASRSPSIVAQPQHKQAKVNGTALPQLKSDKTPAANALNYLSFFTAVKSPANSTPTVAQLPHKNQQTLSNNVRLTPSTNSSAALVSRDGAASKQPSLSNGFSNGPTSTAAKAEPFAASPLVARKSTSLADATSTSVLQSASHNRTSKSNAEKSAETLVKPSANAIATHTNRTPEVSDRALSRKPENAFASPVGDSIAAVKRSASFTEPTHSAPSNRLHSSHSLETCNVAKGRNSLPSAKALRIKRSLSKLALLSHLKLPSAPRHEKLNGWSSPGKSDIQLHRKRHHNGAHSDSLKKMRRNDEDVDRPRSFAEMQLHSQRSKHNSDLLRPASMKMEAVVNGGMQSNSH